MLRIYPPSLMRDEPVVITGIGLITATGRNREEVWDATRRGVSGIRRVDAQSGLPSHLRLAAPVQISLEHAGQLKVMRLARMAAEDALDDAGIDFTDVDRDRFACAVSGHVGDMRWWFRQASEGEVGSPTRFLATQWLPNSACWDLATRYGLYGPRFSHSTACASGLVDVITAARSIQDGHCDLALAGSSEAIDPLFAAGFQQMRVLANDDDPSEACLPFDSRRHGFVMGEGAGMFVLERLSHALARRARIYAEIVAYKALADAFHVTSLNIDSHSLERLIRETLHEGDVTAADVGYVNAHGTGTEQNDLLESQGIRRAFGNAADDVYVSSLKSMLGHLVNASGSVELGLSLLGMRDGFAPPTINLHSPDPYCDLNCLPVVGRPRKFQHALKLSLAFGGHLVAVLVRRWNRAESGFGYPEPARRAA